MTSRPYGHQASISEILGLAVGGGALLAVITAQVIFLAWVL
jgi:hypothetical protein